MLSHLDDREFLAQIEAVDRFMDSMHAYPGRTIGQLYHLFFRVNEIADGALDARRPHASTSPSVRIPVLSIAGRERRDRAAARRPPRRGADARTRPPCGWRRRPAVTSACSPAARRGATTWAWIDEFLAEHGPPHAALQPAA